MMKMYSALAMFLAALLADQQEPVETEEGTMGYEYSVILDAQTGEPVMKPKMNEYEIGW